MKDKVMRGTSSSQLRSGLARLLEAVLAGLIVLVALVASALGQASGPVAATDPAAAEVAQMQTAQAQTGAAPSGQAPLDRPAHAARKPFRAARLTYLDGNVVVEQARSKTQDVAVLNMPLVEGTALSTGDDGQAEIEFEDGSLVRITPNSGVSLLNMSVDGGGNYQTRVAVTGGLIYAELRAGTKYQYSIDAGGNIVTPTENTTLRINLDEPPALVAVLQGAAHLSSVNGTSTIDTQAGQTARADAEQQGAPFVVKDEIAPESWDQWSEDRDQVAAGEAVTQTAARDQYAGDQGYGWSDLDANGNWYDVPGQGQVWQPDMAEESGADASGGQSFDPYGYGSWVWTPAGYSWASSYNWGWLPYRCGQWVYFDQFGWGWQPGINCGVFGFGGYGFGGYGFGVNIGRAPGFWRHPKRPIPGPSPVHPIIHGRVGPTPMPELQAGSSGRLIRVKTIDGHSIDPLPQVAPITPDRSSGALGSALRRDYPVNTATREPALGVAATHTVPWNGNGNGNGAGRGPVQPGEGFQGARSHMLPAFPSYSNQGQRPAAPVARSAPAPAQHSSPQPAAHSSSPAASPHK